jgi:polar amino acid transport system substrate-binding protein
MAGDRKGPNRLNTTSGLRAALNLGNPTLVTKDPATGKARGVTVDLGRALAARLGVSLVAVEYPNVAGILEGLRSNAWDVAFLGVDPARAVEVDFTAAYMDVDNTYLVASDSVMRSVADVDRVGVRIAVPTWSAPDLFLTRELQHASLVRGDTPETLIALLTSGQADAFAADRATLLNVTARFTGWHILDGRFLAVQHALAVPKGDALMLASVQTFVEQAKRSGLVQHAIQRAGLHGVHVAPAAEQ